MPPALDLTGARLGRLTVLRRGDRCHYGRSTWQWICQCDCGAVEAIPQPRLACRDDNRRAARCCSVCARPACIICNQPVANRTRGRRTCSDECRLVQRRSIGLNHYYRHAADPAWRAHREVTRLARRDTSPEAIERERQARAAAAALRPIAAPEEMERRRARARSYGRAYRRRWRAALVADPEAHQNYLDLMAAYRRRRALLGLLAEADTLEDDDV